MEEKPADPIKGLIEIASRTYDIPTGVADNADSPSSASKKSRVSHVIETDTMVVGEDEDGSVKINEYAVVTELGRGAYGKVKLVVHVPTEQYYAIKIMKKSVLQKVKQGGSGGMGGAKTALDSVLLEIAIMKKVNHPNICKLYEVINDVSCNKLYLIIEYIEDGPCYTLEEGCQPMEIPRLRQLCIGICQGLDYLHQIGIVHRDIKPENILVDSQGVPKLTDFGVANDFGDDESGDVVKDTSGTPAFFSPELFNQVPVSGKLHDIWALGVTLYTMAHAKLPFPGNNLTKVCHSVTKTEPEWDPSPDEVFTDLLKKMLNKDLSKRLGAGGIDEVMNHPFLAGHEGTAKQNYTEIEVSESDRETAVLKGDNINLNLLSTIGVMIKIKGRFKGYTVRSKSLPSSPHAGDMSPVTQSLDTLNDSQMVSTDPEQELVEIVHPTSQPSFREEKKKTRSREKDGIVETIEVSDSGSDSESESGSKTPPSQAQSGRAPLAIDSSPRGMTMLKIPNGGSSPSSYKRSFRSEEDVLMESHAEGDLEGVIAKALEGGLEDLTLNCFKFDALPASVFNCGGLITLTAHLNGMQTIPPQVDYLQMLTTLNVGQNELKTLPDEIGNLSSLTHLDCNRNKLERLPDSMANLESLTFMNLDYNNIKEQVPLCLTKIPELEKCYIIGNPGIVTFSEDMNNWKSCILAVDNTPVLKTEWAKIHKKMTNVCLMWNKVYPDQILDYLYVGSVRTVQSEAIFKELGITRIVTAGKQLEIIDPLPEGIDQLLLNVEDITEQDLTPVFDTVDSYIEKARTDGARVLIHCFAGLSRSVTLVCAYLMKKYKMTFKESITFVKKARPNANPNQGFRNQLIVYEKKLFGTSIDPDDFECKVNGPGVTDTVGVEVEGPPKPKPKKARD